jgi:hypothetical protein
MSRCDFTRSFPPGASTCEGRLHQPPPPSFLVSTAAGGRREAGGEPRKGDHVANVVHAANYLHQALKTDAKTRVRDRPKPPKVGVPLEIATGTNPTLCHSPTDAACGIECRES